ncbi:MAG: hypothetical protein M1371_04280 [Actinobacteria bacterium]|nr:hypothetical protein [Actinomycetota bacterium]
MRKLHILGIAFAIVSLLVLASSCVSPTGALFSRQPYPYGSGGGMGTGMMGGGMGPGMMGGGWGNYNPNTNPDAEPITIDQAADAVRLYLNGYGGKLFLTEVMNFAWNFYAEVEEEDTGIHAMELLIDKYTGRVFPEIGPNMMWNTKYGHMVSMMGNYNGGDSLTVDMPVTPEQAKTIAERYLDTNLPGLTVAEADTFYGYYTLHTLENGHVEGMLSVNGYTGAVWYHSWHGPFIDMKEFE